MANHLTSPILLSGAFWIPRGSVDAGPIFSNPSFFRATATSDRGSYRRANAASGAIDSFDQRVAPQTLHEDNGAKFRVAVQKLVRFQIEDGS